MNKLGLSYGHLAVDVFIVVSGLVIGLPIARNGNSIVSVKKFFRRRIQRIVPPYYAALLLCAAFGTFWGNQPTGTIWDNALPITWEKLLWHAGLLQDLPVTVRGGSIAYQLWSIAVEFHIYLLVPLLVVAMRVIGSLATLAITCCLSLTVHLLWPKADTLVHWYVALFLMGAISAQVCVANPWWAGHLRIPALIALIGTLLVILRVGHKTFDEYLPWFDLAIGLSSSALLTSLFFADPPRDWLRRLLSQRWLVAIGVFSYSLYLVHPVVLHAEWLFLQRIGPFSSVQTFFLLLSMSPVVIAFSWIFHQAFERPFMSAARDRVPAAVKAPALESVSVGRADP
jgi:peptidoglycan/LPS O-acetylase OafA/YrhL